MNDIKSLADDGRWICAMEDRVKYMDRIEQLEKELKEAKAKLTANRFIFRTNERHKYQDKIEDLELQRDGQSITITELKKTIEGFRKGYTDLNDYSDKIKLQLEQQKQFTDTNARIALRFKEDIEATKTLNEKEVTKIINNNIFFDKDGDIEEAYPEDIISAILKLVIPNQKYLDRQGVEKILRDIDPSRLGSACWKGEVDKALTAICNLAVKEIGKDKIVEVLEDIYKWKDETDNEYYSRLADEIISVIGSNNAI